MNELTVISADELTRIEQEIKQYKCNMAISMIEIGDRLIRVKSSMPHGDFCKWLDNNVDMSDRNARNYMRVAKIYDTPEKRKSIANLGSTKVLMLAELPNEVRDNFIENVDMVNVSTRELKAMIDKEVEKKKKYCDISQYFAQKDEEHVSFEIEIDKLIKLPQYERLCAEKRTGKKYMDFMNNILNGQLEPIIITKNNIIIDGHERVRAMKDLGKDTITAEYLCLPEDEESSYFELICVKHFLDINRSTYSDSSLSYYFSSLYHFIFGTMAEGAEDLLKYSEVGPKTDQNCLEHIEKCLYLYNVRKELANKDVA